MFGGDDLLSEGPEIPGVHSSPDVVDLDLFPWLEGGRGVHLLEGRDL
jgi:hypothetical protein